MASIAALALAVAGAAALAQPHGIEAPAESVLYEIDAERSDIYWLVYRDGPLRRLGHDHVVSVGGMRGQILLEPRPEQSLFEITIPVAQLVVDDPELRAREGEMLAGQPSEEAIAATRRNMLSERVLDAEDHPLVRIRGTGPIVERGEGMLEITVELLGRSIPLTVPARVRLRNGALEAAGEFRLTHEALGMDPFSAMMGALRVGEPLDIRYRIVARRLP